MCILSAYWRRIWLRAFGQAQQLPDQNRKKDARSTSSTTRRSGRSTLPLASQRISKPPSQKHPPRLPENTARTLREIFYRYDEQLTDKNLVRFDLEKKQKTATDQANMQGNAREREIELCDNEQSLNEVEKETDRLSNEKAYAQQQLNDTRTRVAERKRVQHVQASLYNDRIQEFLKAGGRKQDEPGSFPSIPAAEGLKQACDIDKALRIQRRNLINLHLELGNARKEARKKLEEQGLLEYEIKVRKLSRKIKDGKREVSNLQRTRRSGLNAFYTARGRDLRSETTVASQQQEKKKNKKKKKAVYSNEERALQKDACLEKQADIKRKKDEIERFKSRYEIDLQQHKDDNSSGLDASDSATCQQERSFTQSWIEQWVNLLNELEELENNYLEAIKLAMTLGVEIAVDYEIVGNDFPELLGSYSRDGRTASCSPSNMFRLGSKISRSEPRIEEWMNSARQGSPSFVRAAIAAALGEPFDDSNMTPVETETHQKAMEALKKPPNDANMAALGPINDRAMAKLHESSDNDSIAPWDSVSSANRRPKRRQLLDQYRRQCESLDYD